MSGSSNLNSFRDRGQMAVQLVSCGVLPPGVYMCELVCVCLCVCNTTKLQKNYMFKMSFFHD